MVRIRIVLVVLLSSLLLFLPAQPGLACSGGGLFADDVQLFSIDSMIDWSEYFVKATVIAADDVKQNFILDVISSQKSMPPKQLVLAATSPFSIRGAHKFGALNGCNGGGSVANVHIGDTGYFPLRRNPDGSYSTILQLHDGLLLSKFDDQTYIYSRIDPKAKDSSYNSEKMPLPTEETFIRLVQEKGGTVPILNTTKVSEFMPLPPTAPIYLVTDTGKKYMLPMDGKSVVPLEENWLAKQLGIAPEDCYQAGCVLLSPDTSLQLVRQNDHTLSFQTGYGQPCLLYPWGCVSLEGQQGLFSTTNDALAVWNQNRLDIYQLVNVQRDDGDYPMPHKLISIPLQTTAAISIKNLHGRAVWSNDGNILVFADATGLWWLDLYGEIVPKRVVNGQADHAILPISLTGNGRFLAYSLEGTRQNWILDDLQSNAEYPNLTLSPDGRYGIAFNTTATSPLASLLTIYPRTFPTNGTWDVQWLTAYYDQHYVKTCDSEMGTCHIQFCGTYIYAIGPIPRPYECFKNYYVDRPLNDADYDPNIGLVSATNDGHTIYVEGEHDGYRWNPQIDGKIFDVEWMLPRFYYEYKHP